MTLESVNLCAFEMESVIAEGKKRHVYILLYYYLVNGESRASRIRMGCSDFLRVYNRANCSYNNTSLQPTTAFPITTCIAGIYVYALLYNCSCSSNSVSLFYIGIITF